MLQRRRFVIPFCLLYNFVKANDSFGNGKVSILFGLITMFMCYGKIRPFIFSACYKWMYVINICGLYIKVNVFTTNVTFVILYFP